MWEAFKANVQREVKTTVGRRAQSLSGARPAPRPIDRPPAGATGLVLQDEEDDGFAVVERKKPQQQQQKKPQHIYEGPPIVPNATYLVGGEEGAGDEDRKHRLACRCVCLRPMWFSIYLISASLTYTRHSTLSLHVIRHLLLLLRTLSHLTLFRPAFLSLLSCLLASSVRPSASSSLTFQLFTARHGDCRAARRRVRALEWLRAALRQVLARMLLLPPPPPLQREVPQVQEVVLLMSAEVDLPLVSHQPTLQRARLVAVMVSRAPLLPHRRPQNRRSQSAPAPRPSSQRPSIGSRRKRRVQLSSSSNQGRCHRRSR